MPIYEYQCQKCGHLMEIMHKIDAKPDENCSECGHEQLKRLVSAPMFQLKGSGWYETDFKSRPKVEEESQPAAKTEPSSKPEQDKSTASVSNKEASTGETKD